MYHVTLLKRSVMRHSRIFLVGALILIFLGLSFNAYACLVPLYGAANATMGSDCSSPEEQSARQFCDALKTLSVQTAPSALQAVDASAHAVVSLELDALQTFISPLQLSAQPWSASPPTGDILSLTSVLRL